MMLMSPKLDESLIGDAQEIKSSAERASLLTQQLLAFSRKQVLQPKVIILNNLVSNLERMLRRLIGEDIVLETRLDSKLGLTRADQSQVEQIIMNLVLNSRDALPGGGKIVMETKGVHLGHKYCAQHEGLNPGRFVMIAVSDTGCGMDRETQERIFEPFFTTKRRGKGTGLGLSTVFGIVKQSEGHIEVESRPGKGSTFRIYLPQTEAAAEERIAARKTTSTPTGSESILIVEDDRAVRKMVSKTLKRLGYTVYEARTGVEALQICGRNNNSIRLLMTDVIMPEMNGCELAKRLVKHNPDTKVLYTSGYLENDTVNQIVLDESAGFLQKPFSPSDLAWKIRQALEG